jgi:DNA-directed RNA polymerase subunit F
MNITKNFSDTNITKQEELLDELSGWSSIYCIQTATDVQPRRLQELCTINLFLPIQCDEMGSLSRETVHSVYKFAKLTPESLKQLSDTWLFHFVPGLRSLLWDSCETWTSFVSEMPPTHSTTDSTVLVNHLIEANTFHVITFWVWGKNKCVTYCQHNQPN